MDLDDVSVEVEHVFDAPLEAVFDLLTHVDRMAGLGPEHRSARWLDNEHTRFAGTNTMGEHTWEVVCIVTARERPTAFAFTVGEPEEPSSTWTYALEARGSRTLVRQRFQLGPGRSYLRYAVRREPDKEQLFVEHRTAELRTNMLEVLRAAEALLLGTRRGA